MYSIKAKRKYEEIAEPSRKNEELIVNKEAKFRSCFVFVLYKPRPSRATAPFILSLYNFYNLSTTSPHPIPTIV